MIKNADMPAAPAGKIDRPAPKGADPLGNYTVQAHGMTKYEHVVLEFAKAVVSAGGRPDPDGVMTTAVCLAQQYFKRLDK